MTVLSNCTLAFVCNKSSMPGGVVAEKRRQKATKQIAKIAKIAGIAKIENQNLTTDEHG
jgi:hypothetical protein